MFFSTLPTVAEGFQLKTWPGSRQAEGLAGRPIARGPWADASRHQPASAATVFYRGGACRIARDDSRPPPRRSETIRPCPPGAWLLSAERIMLAGFRPYRSLAWPGLHWPRADTAESRSGSETAVTRPAKVASARSSTSEAMLTRTRRP
jgi:hypothetical protein